MDFLAPANPPNIDEVEIRLDLTGMEKDKALEKLDNVVKDCKRSSVSTLYITFDPAGPQSGETLFQPVARYFKFEKFNGYVLGATPVMTKETGGLFVRFKL